MLTQSWQRPHCSCTRERSKAIALQPAQLVLKSHLCIHHQISAPRPIAAEPACGWSNAHSVICRAANEREQVQPSTAAVESSVWAVPLAEPWDALLMAWFAARANSLLAAQCFVEAVLQLYISGTIFTEVSLGIKLASNRGITDGEGTGSQAAPLLAEQEEAEMLSWVALILLAAQLAGLQPARKGPTTSLAGEGDSDGQRYLAGMKVFVQQALGMWDKGMNLMKLTGLQGAVNMGQPTGGVQSVMQQYTRVVIMTLEVMTVEKLIPSASNHSNLTPVADLSAGQTQSPDNTTLQQQQEETDDTQATQQAGLKPLGYTTTFTAGRFHTGTPRQVAIRLLIGFMGAALGYPYSMDKFVESAYMAYSQGLSAGEVAAQLTDNDFSATGGLVAVAAPAEGLPEQDTGGQDTQDDTVSVSSMGAAEAAVNKQLFGSWLSCVYMSLAQLGAPMPTAQALQSAGWAWAGHGDPADALGLDRFVKGAMKAALEELIVGDPVSEDDESDMSSTSQTTTSPASPPQDNSYSNSNDSSSSDDNQAARRQQSKQLLQEPLEARLQQDLSIAQQFEQLRQAAAMEYLTLGTLRGKQLPPLVKVKDEGLAATSPTLRLLAVQTQLVRRTLALALRLQQQQQGRNEDSAGER